MRDIQFPVETVGRFTIYRTGEHGTSHCYGVWDNEVVAKNGRLFWRYWDTLSGAQAYCYYWCKQLRYGGRRFGAYKHNYWGFPITPPP